MKPSVFWPAVIAGALGLHVLVMAAMVYVATSNDSYAVEPDYYAKALTWDERRAQERNNTELGWTLDFVVVPADPGADPVLRATLLDADGGPVSGARVAVEAFANVRRDDVLNAILAPAPDGYEVAMPMHRNGRWEFRFQITLNDEVFTYRDTRHIWTQVSD